VPPGLVIDAGPLIAILDDREVEHLQSVQGLDLLISARTRIVVPLPIVFEVVKWLTYEKRPEIARAWLGQIQRGAVVLYPGPSEIDEVVAILHMMPYWRGSMEDALLAVTCRRERLPLWTFNYRDLTVFKDLQFWSPG